MTYSEWVVRYRALLQDIAEGTAELEAAMKPLEKNPPRPTMATNPEPDDEKAVPISDAEAYRAMDAVSRIEHLADMGIYTTTRWRLEASCRFHGLQAIVVETNEEIPDNTWMRCAPCMANGTVRWLEVREKRKFEEGS